MYSYAVSHQQAVDQSQYVMVFLRSRESSVLFSLLMCEKLILHAVRTVYGSLQTAVCAVNAAAAAAAISALR